MEQTVCRDVEQLKHTLHFLFSFFLPFPFVSFPFFSFPSLFYGPPFFLSNIKTITLTSFSCLSVLSNVCKYVRSQIYKNYMLKYAN